MERILRFYGAESPGYPARRARRDYFVSAGGELCRAIPAGGGAMVLSGRCFPALAPGILKECRRLGFGAVIVAARPSPAARALSAELCRRVKVYAGKGCFAPGCTMLAEANVWGESLKDTLARAVSEHGSAALYSRAEGERFPLPCSAFPGEALSLRELAEAKENALRIGFSPELCRKYAISSDSLILYDDEESIAAKARLAIEAGAEYIYEEGET